MALGMSLLQGGWLVLVAICLPTQPPGLLAETPQGAPEGFRGPFLLLHAHLVLLAGGWVCWPPAPKVQVLVKQTPRSHALWEDSCEEPGMYIPRRTWS